MVSPELQIYKCFGCAKGEDIFTFTMEMEGMEFPEAVNFLAKKAGVNPDEFKKNYSQKEEDEKEKIIKLNTLAMKYYSFLLNKHKFGKPALEYLKKRGIKEETIKHFELGYSPNSWDGLSKFLTSKKINKDDIVKAGLAKYRQDNNIYDMFRGRLMFPLYDHMGRLVGFSGRALQKDQEPKYINTAETEIFHKQNFLFGLYQSKTSVRQENSVLIVEGEFDMISPFQNGIKNIAASKGTALTLGQINLLKRYTKNIILVFDNDPAGLDAAVRGIDIISNIDLNIKVLVLPKEYKDPDEIVQKDIEKFKELVNNAVPIWDYYFWYAYQKYNFDDVYREEKRLRIFSS